jgi:hypothetical protein
VQCVLHENGEDEDEQVSDSFVIKGRTSTYKVVQDLSAEAENSGTVSSSCNWWNSCQLVLG